MFDPVWRLLRDTRVLRPALIGLAGWIGIVVARHNALNAPVVVGFAIGLAAVAVAFRERGAALAALGIATTAAFASPTGLGSLLVVTGVAIASWPTAVDPRLAAWADVIDGVIALPAVAGLASVVASEPSQRGAVVGVAAAVAVVGSRLRPPPMASRPALASVVGLVGGVSLAAAPQMWDWLGELPPSTRSAGYGLAGAFAVFGMVAVAQELQFPRRVAPTRGQHAVPRRARRVTR